MHNKKVFIRLGAIIILSITITIGISVWMYEENKRNIKKIPSNNISTANIEETNTPEEETQKKGKSLQIYKNESHGYQFKYAPSLIIRENSTDENIILSETPGGHWENSIEISSNPKGLSLEQAFEEKIKSLNSSREDIILSDMYIGNRRAMSYSIKNYSDYGNTGIIFLNGDNIFSIFGDDSINASKINLSFITQSFNFVPALKKENVEENKPFFTDYSGVYYIEQFNVLTKLEGADPTTLKLIGSCRQAEMYLSYYSKDDNHVYINGNIAKNIDALSFQYFGLLNNYDGMPWGTAVARDKNNIYYGCGDAIDLIRKESFKLLDYGYAKDSKSIYYMDSVLKVSDRDSFEVLGLHKTEKTGPFSIDKNNVYYEGQIIKEVSPKDCRTKGLENCLPENWRYLLEDSEKSLSKFTIK